MPGVRLIVAILFSVAVVLSGPLMGLVRARLHAAFPHEFVWIVGGAIGAIVAAAVIAALARIRDRRPLRIALLAAALALGAAYALVSTSGRAEVDVVERFHFIEYGLAALLFYRVWRPTRDPAALVLPVLAALIVATCDEWFQWYVPVRVGELADIVLDMVAVVCGLLFAAAIDPPAPFIARMHRGGFKVAGVMASVALIVLAVFLQSVHMGYLVSRPDFGSFRSKYRAEQLLALAADRETRWRTHPPLTFSRYSQEDQYMDEALWHVRRRNDAWAAGDRATAWNENRILEVFFAPVLDTPSYVSKVGHRWPAAQKEDAQRTAPPADGTYVSDAEPLPIFLWSRRVFWPIVLALAAAFSIMGVFAERRSEAALSGPPVISGT